MSSPFPNQPHSRQSNQPDRLGLHGQRCSQYLDRRRPRLCQDGSPGFLLYPGRRSGHRSLQLAPDGKTAVYARGSELNQNQESANPTSATEGAKQQVFALDLDRAGSQPRLLGEMGCEEEGGEDIRLSPDGKWAVWTAKKKLWLASIDGKQQAKELAVIRGSASQPKWSPDGKHIAFVTGRGDHSLIGIYDFDRDSIRYLAPSSDRDTMPRWSPNGRQITFIRTPGVQQRLPVIPARPEPWALWIARCDDWSRTCRLAEWKPAAGFVSRADGGRLFSLRRQRPDHLRFGARRP